MKRAALAIALLATGAASAVQMASQPWVTNRITQATAATLQDAKDYTDAAIAGAGGLTPEMVTNIVLDVAPAPGDYLAVSNAAMNAVDYTDSATNALADALTTWDNPIIVNQARSAETAFTADSASYASESGQANFATGAGYADWTTGLAGETQPIRRGDDIFAQMDAATATNAAQTAALAAMPAAVTNIVREVSGGIWDAALEVWWTPRMRNGSLTYEATTNVNLNAEN